MIDNIRQALRGLKDMEMCIRLITSIKLAQPFLPLPNRRNITLSAFINAENFYCMFLAVINNECSEIIGWLK